VVIYIDEFAENCCDLVEPGCKNIRRVEGYGTTYVDISLPVQPQSWRRKN